MQCFLSAFRVFFTLVDPIFVLWHTRLVTLIGHKFLENWKVRKKEDSIALTIRDLCDEDTDVFASLMEQGGTGGS